MFHRVHPGVGATLAVFAIVPIGLRVQLVETDAAADYRIEMDGHLTPLRP